MDQSDKVLILGCGTGLDLPYLPKLNSISAIDITKSMVDQTTRRANELGLEVDAKVMDGQNLEFDNDAFDAVILHLILAVIPDPNRCFNGAVRVLKPGGKLVVFDKFVQAHSKAGLLRKVLNPVMTFLPTDVTRDIYAIAGNNEVEFLYDDEAGFNGFFRHVLIQKSEE